MEWCFFIVEIATAIVYYHTWDRIDTKTHLRLAWLDAGTSWCTLVMINGILTFMLTPGQARCCAPSSALRLLAFGHY